MIAFIFECFFTALTLALMGLAAYITDTLKKAQKVNPTQGRYARLHRWCFASAIVFIIVTASVCLYDLLLSLNLRYRAMKRMRHLRVQRWNACPADPTANDGEKAPLEAEWCGPAAMAAIRTGPRMQEMTGRDLLWASNFGVFFLLEIVAIGFAAATVANMTEPTLYAMRGTKLLRKLPPAQAALLALGIVHVLSWIGRYLIAAWEQRVVEAFAQIGQDAVAPGHVEECIYVPELERFRGFLFAIPPHHLKPTEAYCSLCSKPFIPPLEGTSWTTRHMFVGQIATALPLWRFRCGHTFDIQCLETRFKEGHMGCPACSGEGQRPQNVPGHDAQVTESKNGL